jgi:uncharacterized protein YciI
MGRAMKYLVLTIRKPMFDDSVREAHYAFLDDLRARGMIEQAGSFSDRSGGAYVLIAGDLEEARRTAEQDPLHVRNCSTVTVYEWNSN